METQGRFRPDKWGYTQRGEYSKKYIDAERSKASTTEWGFASSNPTQDQWVRPELPLAIMRLLRKYKQFVQYMVDPGREIPLQEVVTKHQSGNEIRRPQSKLSPVDEPTPRKKKSKYFRLPRIVFPVSASESIPHSMKFI